MFWKSTFKNRQKFNVLESLLHKKLYIKCWWNRHLKGLKIVKGQRKHLLAKPWNKPIWYFWWIIITFKTFFSLPLTFKNWIILKRLFFKEKSKSFANKLHSTKNFQIKYLNMYTNYKYFFVLKNVNVVVRMSFYQ